ncbi:MAG: EAL domain-containing protein [Cyanobacteria bacterium P01_D01_bin.14]
MFLLIKTMQRWSRVVKRWWRTNVGSASSNTATQRSALWAAMAQHDVHFRAIYQQAGVGISQADLTTGRYISVNQRFCDIVGYTETELLRMSYRDITHPDDVGVNTASVSQLLSGRTKTISAEKRYIRRDGTIRWVRLNLSVICDDQGRPLIDLGVVEDISDHKRAEAALADYKHQLETLVSERTMALEREMRVRDTVERRLFQEQELAQVTLHSIGDGVITTDAAGRVDYLNPAAEQLTGWTLATAKGRQLGTVFQVVDECDRTPLPDPVVQVLHATPLVVNPHPMLLSRDGQDYGIDWSAAPIHNREQQIIGAVIVFRDVTQSRQLTQKLSWQATHDALTGLVNRQQFEHHVVEHLAQLDPDRAEPPHVLCYLDLDRFKIVNDTCGHGAGDELLKQISKVIESQVRTSDIVARLGGDEFGILLRDCSLSQGKLIANSLRETVHGFRFVWGERAFGIGVSIGLVQLEDPCRSLVEVMSAADTACYAAKESGRNQIHVHQPSDLEIARQHSKRQWSLRIRTALETDGFRLYWQPIVPAKPTDMPVCYREILLRMVDGQGALIMPGAFMPAAERYGLMPEIDRWVVETFLKHCRRAALDTTPGQVYTLNLSSASIGDSYFCEWIHRELTQHEALARQLCFEISETNSAGSFSQIIDFINRLKPLGCRFALDDFGSGVYCFKSLQQLPIDYLKIDGSFITSIAKDANSYAIVEAINHVGKSMGLQTVAESVDSLAVRACLQEIGVDYVQGYVLSNPRPLAATGIPQNLAR